MYKQSMHVHVQYVNTRILIKNNLLATTYYYYYILYHFRLLVYYVHASKNSMSPSHSNITMFTMIPVLLLIAALSTMRAHTMKKMRLEKTLTAGYWSRFVVAETLQV